MAVLAALLANEVLSGALRYSLDRAGFPFLIYAAKAAVLLAVLAKLPRLIGSRMFWLVALMLGGSSAMALAHEAAISNIGFAIFVYAPLAFGVLYGNVVERRSNLLCTFLLVAWLVSLVGILVDMATDVPWKGYSYQLAGIDLQGSREWGTYGVDRLAGFSRLSSVLAMMLATFALYVHSHVNSRALKLALFVATIGAIALTTTKSVVVAYVFGIGALSMRWRPNWLAPLLLISVAIGVLLPLSAVLFKQSGISAGQDVLLSSLDDRLITTWPGFYEIVEKSGALLTGVGFGAVGSPTTLFPILGQSGNRLGGLGVADNLALYAWGMLGVLGVLLYLGLFPLMRRLSLRNTPHARGLLGVTICLCLVSWTTDILEALIPSLFIGLAVSAAWPHRSSPQGL
jgi:hypothetical protein